jgi:hypothetical protein
MRAGPMVAALVGGCVPRADAGGGAGSLHAAGDECTAQSKQDVRVDTRLIDDWAELEPTLAGVYLAEISRFWSEIPREDRRCTRDDECALLSTTCFDASVRADRRAPYDEVLAVHGVCIDPAAGACAPSRAVARCDARLCTVR